MRLPEKFDVLVITLSDRAHAGTYEDLSGPAVAGYVREVMAAAGWQYAIRSIILPDDAAALKAALAQPPAPDLVITTGGTGIGPRDITPDVVRPMLTKEIPGIMDHIRMKYGAGNPKALLSRAVAGAMGNTLVYTLPGSVKAVHEYMSEIAGTLVHTFYMLYGIDVH
jgi:molybdenum cofactor synthesis domain-containing protein